MSDSESVLASQAIATSQMGQSPRACALLRLCLRPGVLTRPIRRLQRLSSWAAAPTFS